MKFIGSMLSAAATALTVSLASQVEAAPRQLFALPIAGEMSDGRAAFGQATGFSDGVGSFWVQIPAGANCFGTWDIRDRNPTIILPVRCNDGAKGQAVIARQPGLMSGSAIVALRNGKRGQFVFGNMTFEQTFGRAGKARTR